MLNIISKILSLKSYLYTRDMASYNGEAKAAHTEAKKELQHADGMRGRWWQSKLI